MELKDWIQKDMSRFIRRHEPKTKVNVPIRHEQATLLSTRDYEQQIRMGLTHNRFNHACELFNELKQAFLSLPIDHQEERRQYYRLLQLSYKEIYDYVADKHKTSRILEEISGSDNVFGTAQTGPRATAPRTSVEDSMMRHVSSLKNPPNESLPTARADEPDEPLADISSMIDAAANSAPDDALSLVKEERAPLPPPPFAGSEPSEQQNSSAQSTPTLPPLPQSIVDSGLADKAPAPDTEQLASAASLSTALGTSEPDDSLDGAADDSSVVAPQEAQEPEQQFFPNSTQPEQISPSVSDEGADAQQTTALEAPVSTTPGVPVAMEGYSPEVTQFAQELSTQDQEVSSSTEQPEQTLPTVAAEDVVDAREEVATNEPPTEDAVKTQALVDSETDELTRAREAFKQVRFEGPRIIRKAAPQPQRTEVAPATQGFSSLYVRGVQAMHAKDYKTAAQLFLRRVQENPNDRASRIRLTECLEVLDGTITR